MENVKVLEEDKARIAQDYLKAEADKINKENAEKLHNSINHILETDLKVLLTELWGSQELPFIVEIKKVQYLERLSAKQPNM